MKYIKSFFTIFLIVILFVNCENSSVGTTLEDDKDYNYINSITQVSLTCPEEWNIIEHSDNNIDTGNIFSIYLEDTNNTTCIYFYRYKHECDSLLSLNYYKNYYVNQFLNSEKDWALSDTQTIYRKHRYFWTGKAIQDSNFKMFIIASNDNYSYMLEYSNNNVPLPSITSKIEATLNSMNLELDHISITPSSLELKMALETQDSLIVSFEVSRFCSGKLYIKTQDDNLILADNWNIFDSDQDTMNPVIFNCRPGFNRIALSPSLSKMSTWVLDTSYSIELEVRDANIVGHLTISGGGNDFEPTNIRSSHIYNNVFKYPSKLPRYFLSGDYYSYNDTNVYIFGVTDTSNCYPFNEDLCTFTDTFEIPCKDINLGKTVNIENLSSLDIGLPYKLLIKYYSKSVNRISIIEAPCDTTTFLLREE